MRKYKNFFLCLCGINGPGQSTIDYSWGFFCEIFHFMKIWKLDKSNINHNIFNSIPFDFVNFKLIQYPCNLNFLQILVSLQPLSLLKLINWATEIWLTATFEIYHEVLFCALKFTTNFALTTAQISTGHYLRKKISFCSKSRIFLEFHPF